MVAPQNNPEVPSLLALGRAIQVELRRMVERQAIVLLVLERFGLLLHLHNAGCMEVREPEIADRFRGIRERATGSLGFLGIRRVLALAAAEDRVLSAARQHMKLVREAAADRAAVGLDGAKLHADP